MFYRKNLPGWERAIRVTAGVPLIGWGLLAFPADLSENGFALSGIML